MMYGCRNMTFSIKISRSISIFLLYANEWHATNIVLVFRRCVTFGPNKYVYHQMIQFGKAVVIHFIIFFHNDHICCNWYLSAYIMQIDHPLIIQFTARSMQTRNMCQVQSIINLQGVSLVITFREINFSINDKMANYIHLDTFCCPDVP